jgi:hypothetical protein
MLLDPMKTRHVSGINLDEIEEKSNSSDDDMNLNINNSFTNSPKRGESKSEIEDEIIQITKSDIKVV